MTQYRPVHSTAAPRRQAGVGGSRHGGVGEAVVVRVPIQGVAAVLQDFVAVPEVVVVGVLVERVRTAFNEMGYDTMGSETPIVPVMLHDAATAARFATAMLTQGIYVVAFSYPVVPQGRARIRTQMSAALTPDDLTLAIDAFGRVKRDLGI